VCRALLRGWAFFFQRQNLMPAIRPTIRANMMRQTRLMTLRTIHQLWQLEMMMTAPFRLGGFGYLSLW
jgi:hypothetical protein